MPEYIEQEALLQDISETVLFSVRGGAELPTPEMRGANKVIDRIKSAKTVDAVEVRHGEWLPYPSDAYMKCSVCGMEYHKSRMPDVVGYCPNPNCGAKMDGKGQNND